MKKISKRLFEFGAIAIALIVAGNAYAVSYKEINAEDLVKLQKDNKNLVIIDSRRGDWFDGTVIKGAHQLGLEDTTPENLAKLAPKKDQPLVFYCVDYNCPASVKASHKATKFGYTNVLEYRGGIDEWRKKGLPTETIAKPKS